MIYVNGKSRIENREIDSSIDLYHLQNGRPKKGLAHILEHIEPAVPHHKEKKDQKQNLGACFLNMDLGFIIHLICSSSLFA